MGMFSIWVNFGYTALLCCITGCSSPDTGLGRSPVAFTLAFITNLLILIVDVTIVYAIRVYFVVEANEPGLIARAICSLSICEITFVYKLILSNIIYHVAIISLMTLINMRHGDFGNDLFDSYWPFKILFKYLLIFASVLLVPEILVIKLYWVFFLLASLFIVWSCFATFDFSYGLQDYSVDLSQTLEGGSLPESNAYRSGFIVLVITLLSLVGFELFCIVSAHSLGEGCRFNFLVVVSYIATLLIAIIISGLPAARRKIKTNGFIATVFASVSTYFAWNVVLMDDPTDCTATLQIGEWLHAFTVGVFLLLFCGYSLFYSLRTDVRPSVAIKKSKNFHIALAGCFCYLSLVVIDWSIPAVFDGELVQETFVFFPLVVHSTGIMLLMLLFAAYAMVPLCSTAPLEQ